jgi:predicted lactoylglutathione lyase
MATKIFVNLPISDLKRSIGFFSQLGFSFNKQFTDQNATCMIIAEDIFVMLLVKPFFQTFTNKEICNANKNTEVIICLSAESRSAVDDIVEKAIHAGASTRDEIQDQGWMYGRGFQDLDGHLWEIMFMDKNAIGHN